MKFRIFSNLSLLFLNLTIFSSINASAGYISGKQTYNLNRDYFPHENGFFVDVPISYDKPNSKFTQIYAYRLNEFDYGKPTVIFVTGGPGQSSHMNEEFFPLTLLRNFNVIFFDQRGIAFSKPELEEDYKSPEFYSSVNTANDIEKIRKHLGVSDVSVYGVSYGTIPATIYGNLFKSTSRSIVLEGVMAEGFDGFFQESRFLQKTAQDYFDALPAVLKEKLMAVSNEDPNFAEIIFPALIKGYMISGYEYLDNLTKVFMSLLSVPGKEFVTKYQQIVSTAYTGQKYRPNLDDDLVHNMIHLKELGTSKKQIWLSIRFNRGKFEIKNDSNSYVYSLRSLGLMADVDGLSVAAKYKLDVPVYYIQGSMDAATIPQNATRAFKANRNSTIFIVEDAGHSVANDIRGRGSKVQNSVYFETLMTKALLGSKIDKFEIDRFNSSGNVKIHFSIKETNNRCSSFYKSINTLN